ncbi:MAG: hypothetical protein ACRD26_13515, partial [Vicinamibacterales bacterium]
SRELDAQVLFSIGKALMNGPQPLGGGVGSTPREAGSDDSDKDASGGMTTPPRLKAVHARTFSIVRLRTSRVRYCRYAGGW